MSKEKEKEKEIEIEDGSVEEPILNEEENAEKSENSEYSENSDSSEEEKTRWRLHRKKMPSCATNCYELLQSLKTTRNAP